MKAISFLTLLLVLPLFAAEPEGKSPDAAKKESYGGEPEKREGSGHIFAWPFMEWEKMQPRGGTSKGSDVTLLTTQRPAWENLNQPKLSKKEQDRRAILAMAGDFRVSFDFVELTGFKIGYTPPRPYFSWGTEHVRVIADEENFISLQHALVMFFEDKEGKVSGPHVMKHWRQDWTFEDKSILAFQGDLTWKSEETTDREGRWSQAVFQVDDSPRYEVMGEWTHRGGLHQWRSDNAPRPLPRREFSAREDYGILEGTHEITITPTGWLHVQQNQKLNSVKNGSPEYVGTEIGVNRYEAITAPTLSGPFSAYWEKTAPYWQAVRDEWKKVETENDSFTLRPKVEDKKLWQMHFEEAGEIEKADKKTDSATDAKHAAETVRKFVK